ncbi:MAG: hypothetical protein CMD08_02795 [Flavobacteriales bacterium]|nr:hypothetical protein [Flavobacteriales bacterium]
MPENIKILVIRFSSIGDIILTTPVVRCLRSQLNAKIDFLTKAAYKQLLVSNPNINEVISLEQHKNDMLKVLRSKEYNFVIDLQSNFRSFKLRLMLGVKSYTFSKDTFKRYILIYFGINLLKNHIVDRYFRAVSKLNVCNDEKGLDYFLSNSMLIDFDVDQDYICWCIGGAHKRKQLSSIQVANVISQLEMPVLLLGSAEEKQLSVDIITNIKSNNVYDFCGETSIEESAYLIRNSKLVLTNDTGMMHIASAFDTPIISFWGCTKPSLGFSPYMAAKKSKCIITSFSDAPCSKHGKYCKFQSNGCIKEIKPKIIYEAVVRLIK